MVDYNLSFRKPFSDIRKLIIGIVVNIIPIVNLISYGYTLESSDIKKGEQTDKMEEWEDFGGFFVKGLLAFIISLIYGIPALIVGIIAFAVALGPLFGQLVLMDPQRVQTMNPEEFFPMFVPYLLAALPLVILFAILILIATYIAPVGVLRYIKTDTFSEAFNFKEITRYIFTGDYILAWLLVLVLNIALVGILSNIPFVGTAIASFITGIIGFSLYAGVMMGIDKKN
ncbi:MAG: hypothetical protein AMQ22_01719 [Candidatus Methanofastidiosum methylothiophilum]|uniref:DUF4013 domain-containing protein n=1 Tax=Candidatus Methanofastidiosum methylothiophilum TaxID=1705564 RepID=A0A150IVT2_9EURY|nr:MAG: hypothetical protein AMQ22_01719 [Candidatus Methanofastidiosum methylthiophilus]